MENCFIFCLFTDHEGVAVRRAAAHRSHGFWHQEVRNEYYLSPQLPEIIYIEFRLCLKSNNNETKFRDENKIAISLNNNSFIIFLI